MAQQVYVGNTIVKCTGTIQLQIQTQQGHATKCWFHKKRSHKDKVNKLLAAMLSDITLVQADILTGFGAREYWQA